LEVGSGFNVLVGKNNSGKTAVLEPLSPVGFQSRPYYGKDTDRDVPRDPQSRVTVSLVLEWAELRNTMLRSGRHFDLGVPGDVPQGELVSWLERALETTQGRYDLQRTPEVGWSGETTPLFSEITNSRMARFMPLPNRQAFHFAGYQSGVQESLSAIVGSLLSTSVYVFRAERLSLGRSEFSQVPTLAPDAANLASVLSNLQGRNPARFETINEHMRDIFDNVYHVSAVPAPSGGNFVEIRVWSVSPQSQRDDLAFPLSESGTGVGQVLAILTVVVDSDFGKVIVIDEPNSFLHPGAAKKLIRILHGYQKHQYIIATHSPEVIAAANPSTLNLVRWTENGSTISQSSANEFSKTSLVLLEVGSALSDVFGADAILWVEGPTEQVAFPKILSHFGNAIPSGLSILAVRSTGEITGKRPSASMIWDIYKQLSTTNALLPPAIAICLDTDNRAKSEVADLIQRSSGLLRFLPRRTFENYLLHFGAITTVLNELPSFKDCPLTDDTVATWIQANGTSSNYLPRDHIHVVVGSDEWLTFVDGPSLLGNLFASLSGTREEYRKMRDSIRLTEVILSLIPDHFRPLADFLGLLIANNAIR
jgi:hypothetical protein